MDKPWETEPDFKVFESSGLRCVLNRSDLGCWTGYVAVPADHPWYGLDYNAKPVTPPDPQDDSMSIVGVISVHGGLTYSGTFHDSEKHKQVTDLVWGQGGDWYFGFDCAHHMDYMPCMEKYSVRESELLIYRDIDYATGECARMAAQLAIVGRRRTR